MMNAKLLRQTLILAVLLGGMISLTLLPRTAAAPAPQEGSPIVLAAGDAANCGNWEDEETARLVEAYPGAPVLLLGDGAEDAGLLREYNECYGPTWGRFKDRTYPVPGNREYGSGNPIGYFTYWGAQATPLEPGCVNECKGYYSFDVGTWHIVALNSEVAYDVGSDQEQWLRADLAAHPTTCTLAYWHRPYFSSGQQGGNGLPLLQALYDYGVELVLGGHDHLYERFAPQSPSGQLEPQRGVRQFIVGTGGHRHRDFAFIQPNSEARDSEVFGVLKLTLHPDSYDWEFIPIAGQSFTDAGSTRCVTVGGPPPPAGATESIAISTGAPATTTTATALAATTNASATGGAITASPATNSVPAAGLDYTVQAGDTLSLIALRYGLDWRTLAAVNQLSNPEVIEVGQVIRLPGVESEAPASSAAGTTTVPSTTAPSNTATAESTNTSNDADLHIVVSGDTVVGIATQYGLDWRALLQLNGLTETSVIQIGQGIRLR